jgi:hypothetical protein
MTHLAIPQTIFENILTNIRGALLLHAQKYTLFQPCFPLFTRQH